MIKSGWASGVRVFLHFEPMDCTSSAFDFQNVFAPLLGFFHFCTSFGFEKFCTSFVCTSYGACTFAKSVTVTD